MCLAVAADKHRVQMPAPVRIPMMINPALTDFRGKHRAETIPPVPYRLMADVNAPFME